MGLNPTQIKWARLEEVLDSIPTLFVTGSVFSPLTGYLQWLALGLHIYNKIRTMACVLCIFVVRG